MDPPSMASERFLPIKTGESGSHFGKDDFYIYIYNCFPERDTVGSAFLFRWRQGD